MTESRKLAAILAADVVGYSRLAGADEDLTLARLRALRSDLIDPIISVHHGRVVKRTGDGSIVEFRSVVDAVRCAVEVQNGMIERNAGLPPERRIEFRIGIHLGDVVEESDGDLMGDGVNIAARLEGIAKPGTIYLSDDAYRQVRARLDLAVRDLGEQSLKNIALPMRVYALEVGLPAQARPAAAPKPARRSIPVIWVTAAIALLVVIAGGAWFGRDLPQHPSPPLGGERVRAERAGEVGDSSQAHLTPTLSPQGAEREKVANAPAHLSIVVLPFTNLSGDPKQDYFADGITENLTTDLSRIRNSFVIARNTAFTYKGKSIDAKEIGKELDVRYVLEGSVQRDGNRVRVNAQLIDAESGAHLWAERFEEDLADLFKLQDDVVARLANALGYELVKAEAAKGAHSTNPDAIDLTMQGWAQLWKQPTKINTDAAQELFGRALQFDANNAEALVGLAYAHIRGGTFGWTVGPEANLDDQLRLISRASAINPGYALGYYVKSVALFIAHKYPDALEAARTAASFDPNLALAYAGMGRTEFPQGLCDQAVSHFKQAFRLSPRDPTRGDWHMSLGVSDICLGRDDEAQIELKSAIDNGYRTWTSYAMLAAGYALVGNDAEARSALAEAKRQAPDLTIKWAQAHGAIISRVVEGLRKAGLPEDDAPKLSIVVLPFENLSGDAKQDYLADVLTDELTTYISRIPGSFVIARNTAFTYKGKPTDVKQIGKDLGVRYALEGSVQPTDKRIRTNAQLIDAETGAHLWAEEFDTDKTDLLQTEDEIVTRLAHVLQIQMTDIEAARLQRVRPANMDAEDLALQCQAVAMRSRFVGPDADIGYRLCQQSLDSDPNNVRALALLSEKFWAPVAIGHSSDPEGDLAKADALVTHALAIDPNSARSHYAKSGILYGRRRFDEMIVEDERVIALDPSAVEAYGAIGNALTGQGHYERAWDYFVKAIRLSPNDPRLIYWYVPAAYCQIALGHDDQAIGLARKAIALNPKYSLSYSPLAAALALTGKLDDARDAVRRHNALDTPIKSITAMKRSIAPSTDNPAVAAYWSRMEDGLRKAGMPEK